MSDFDLRHGRVMDGVLRMAPALLTFVLVPFGLVMLWAGLVGSDDWHSGPLPDLLTYAVLSGVMVAAAYFFNGFYPLGSRSRLFFGVLASGMAIVYLFILFLSGPFLAAEERLGVQGYLEAELLLAIFAMWQVARATGHACEYLAHAETWGAGQGRRARPKKPPASASSEFGLGEGDACLGSRSAMRAAFYLSLAALALVSFRLLLPSMGSEALEQMAFLGCLGSMAWWVAILSYPLVVLAWCRGLYPRGTLSRLTFGLSFCGVLAILVWLALESTGLAQALAGLGVDAQVGSITLLLMLVLALSGLRYLAEFHDRRRGWRSGQGLKVSPAPPLPLGRRAEISPRTGSLERGVRGAARALALFLALPLIVVVLGTALLGAMDSPLAAGLEELLGKEGGSLVVWGLAVMALSFVTAFYPRGSLGRLLFGLARALFVGLYLWAILLGGELEWFIRSQGLPLSLGPIWALLTVFIVFLGLFRIGEYADHRRAFLVSILRALPRPPERGRHDALADFRPRYGRCISGVREARKAAGRYWVWPSVLIMVTGSALIALADTMQMGHMELLSQELERAMAIILWLALPLLLLTFLRGFYPKGSWSRLCFGWAAAILLAIWIWSVTDGGQLFSSLVVEDMSIGVDLDASGLMLVFMALEMLWGLFFTVEFISYRKGWMLNGYVPVNGKRGRGGLPRDL